MELGHSKSEFLRASVDSFERRAVMSLDSAYFYARHLEQRLQAPDLFKICNSLKTLDLALKSSDHWNMELGRLTEAAWTKIRNQLFRVLITQFSGRLVFLVNSEGATDKPSEWSQVQGVDFYPCNLTRSNEFYRQSLLQLEPSILAVLKRKFAANETAIEPEDFAGLDAPTTRDEFMQRLYDICEDEAERGKSAADNLWRDLESKSADCKDVHRRKELRTKMNRIKLLWGSPRCGADNRTNI